MSKADAHTPTHNWLQWGLWLLLDDPCGGGGPHHRQAAPQCIMGRAAALADTCLLRSQAQGSAVGRLPRNRALNRNLGESIHPPARSILLARSNDDQDVWRRELPSTLLATGTFTPGVLLSAQSSTRAFILGAPPPPPSRASQMACSSCGCSTTLSPVAATRQWSRQGPDV